jgi:hypothetical protein
MKVVLSVIIVISFLTLGDCSGKNGNQEKSDTKPEQNHIQLRVGSYLSINYIGRLSNTRSPKLAQNDSVPICADITLSDDSSTQFIFGNYHEDLVGFKMDRDGKLSTFEAFPEAVKYYVKVINSNEFILSTTDGIESHYKYVGDYSRWVSMNLLEGEYKDSTNKIFSFSDSILITPSDQKYVYEVCIDCYGGPPPCDCIYLDSIPYHFSFSSDTLRICEYYGEDKCEIHEKPKWLLVKRQTQANQQSNLTK